MLLTLYYMAATWLQSWRLNSIRPKIAHLYKHNGTLLLYKDLDSSCKDKCDGHQHAEMLQHQYLGLKSCINKKDARVGDLMWYFPNKFGLSLYPKQILDVSEWIVVSGKKTLLPLELPGAKSSSFSQSNVLYFVIEADFNSVFSTTQNKLCQVEDFGVACAWKSEDFLSLLIESDEEHLVKLTASFLTNNLSIDPGLEIIRIQSVEIIGNPCFLLNVDSIPTLNFTDMSRQKLVLAEKQWQNRISLLRSFSHTAAQAAKKREPVSTNGHWCAVLVPGGGLSDFNMEREIYLKTETKTLEIENTMEVAGLCTDDLPVVSDITSLQEGSLVKMTSELENQPQITCSVLRDCSVVSDINRTKENSVKSLSKNFELENPTEIASPDIKNSPVVSEFSRSEESVSLVKRDPKSVSDLNRLEDKSISCSVTDEPLDNNDNSVSLTNFTTQNRSSASTDSLLATPLKSGSSRDSLGSLRTVTTAAKASYSSHSKTSSETSKPPNIIIYSESSVSVDSVKAALSTTVDLDRYVIYSLNLSEMLSSPWLNQAALVVVCGSVPAPLVSLLIHYILHSGGAMLCLCSDLLGVLLPMFCTSEVKPDQLVTFSYSSWKHVQMMHDIFCYQASSSSAKFSLSDEQNSYTANSIPETIEVMDKNNKAHTLTVNVLGVEETWQTPSLIVAQAPLSHGRVVFSQVHLEADPIQYESDGNKMQTLKENNRVRLEILMDILSSYLGLLCKSKTEDFKYTTAYFLGTHELKQQLMDRLKHRLDGDVLKLQNISLKFCGKGMDPPEATATFMPILMYSCPQSFSTFDYFENLKTKHLGRLVIYTEVLTTSMYLIQGSPLAHGLAIIPIRQTMGVGRGGNIWLSPPGCAMFSLQIHIPLNSEMGQHLPFIQHVIALAIVHSISSQPGLEDLNLRLKWPNDIYANNIKLGGLIVTSVVLEETVIINTGCGLNLNNKYPTLCINDMIDNLNNETGGKIQKLSKERYFAIVMTELESLIEKINAGKQDEVTSLYYKYWLHEGAEVDVKDLDGNVQQVTITGINEFGFLKVKGKSREFTVQPDGNSFDMMAGLIAPKTKS